MSTFARQLQQFQGRKQPGIKRTIKNIFLLLPVLAFLGCSPGVRADDPVSAQPTQISEVVEPVSQAGSATPDIQTLAPAAVQLPGVSITLTADGDAYVKESDPDANYGKEKFLRVDSGTNANEESFLHFTVTPFSGIVQSAVLRLYTGANESKNGPAVHHSSSAYWSEDAITWNNRPSYDSQALDNLDQMGKSTWVEYDVTTAVKGPGAHTFIFTADSEDAIAFTSRESNRAPELVVSFTPVPTPTLSAEDAILVGAGNISTCLNDNDELTARLLDAIPGTVFTTGDNVYEDGAYQEFLDCYDPTWGRHKDRTYPAPGKQEYDTPDASGYFQYFSNIPSYYAYDLGNWRVYALNSETRVGEDSKQAKWLKIDLATHPRQCILAYWNTPRWSSGEKNGSNPDMQVLWEILYQSGVELVINGLEQNYERFAPMNAAGQADPMGVRQIVVGTGGGDLDKFGPPLPTSEVRDSSTYGVLKLTLRANSYDWEFIPVAGSIFTDSGSTECH